MTSETENGSELRTNPLKSPVKMTSQPYVLTNHPSQSGFEQVQKEECTRSHVVGWYRTPLWYAHLTFLKAFATFNLAVVPASLLIDGFPQFERAFWVGLIAATVITLAMQIFKLNPRVG